MKPAALVAAGAVFTAIAAILTLQADGYQAYVIGTIALTTLVATGLNVLMGLTAQISIGQVGFYALGAYSVALLTMNAGVPFWLAVLVAAVFTGVVGILLALPAKRLAGPYLAMMTIAFALVVEHGLHEWRSLTGGGNGLFALPVVPFFGVQLDPAQLAALTIVLAACGLFAFWLLKVSRWGLAMRAVRDSEVAAAAVGISPAVVKVVAFGIGASFAGFAGSFYGPLTGFINPESFPLLTSIIFVLALMAGGTGTVLGPLAGAVVVVIIPELLAGAEQYRLLFVGAFLLVVLLIAPRGMVGTLSAFMPDRTGGRVAARDFDLAAHLRGVTRSGLSVHGLSIAFGGVRAAQDVGLEVTPGGITSLIGPNGAGKTTVLNLISGFYRPDAGQVALDDLTITGLPNERLARLGVARTFQTAQLFGDLTVADNVRVALSRGRAGMPFRPYALNGTEGPDMETVLGLLAFVGYRGPHDVPADSLPHVDRRLVEIARALALRPAVMLLDEPAAGLNQSETRELGDLLRRIADAGVAMLLVEHDMELVMGISDTVVVLDSGKVIARGLPRDIQHDPDVQAAYLGQGKVAGVGRTVAWQGERDDLLNVAGLRAGYGGAPVIEDISFQLHGGEMLAILGANGAGKSTTMAALSGLLRPIEGAVQLDGVDLAHLSAGDIARQGLVLVPEGRQVFPELSVEDNIVLGSFARGKAPSREAMDAIYGRYPRLRERARQRAGLLSGGEQQMLAIARGLIAKPRVLLLDEPSLGLAPTLIESLYADLAALRDEGMTILLVDQMAELALSVVDRAIVLESGRIVQSGTAEEISAGGALTAAYLGEDSAADQSRHASGRQTVSR